MRFVEVTLGVPKLGIVKEIYDMDNPGDCEAWDTNTSNGCTTLNINQLGHLDPRKGNTMNEEITNSPVEADVATAAPKLTDAEIDAILAGKTVFAEDVETSDEATVH